MKRSPNDLASLQKPITSHHLKTVANESYEKKTYEIKT